MSMCKNEAKRPRKGRTGFSLLELMMAFTIFVVVLGAVAQALITYYGAMAVQRERMTATQHCSIVLNQMRQVRESAAGDFPDVILDTWPDGSSVDLDGLLAWEASLPVQQQTQLRQEQILVRYTNTGANPLEVGVIATWRDARNRPISLRMTTLLTDQ